MVGKEGFGVSAIVGKFRALVINKVKANLARAIRENEINVLAIDEYIDILSEKLKEVINPTLEEYGLTMPEFYITSISTPDDDPNFRRLKQQFADKTLLVRQEEIRKAEAEAAQGRKIVEAQTEAKLKMVGAQGEAEALRIKAQAEADAYRAKAFAEADEMKAKGYTYQQETSRLVGMEAMKNGITGGSDGGSLLGDVAGLGITLGAMGSVMNMAKDVLDPVLNDSAAIGAKVSESANTSFSSGEKWDCTACGTKNITSKFCPECGAKRPEVPVTWDCSVCGAKNITSKFCPECGTKKPE